MDFEEFEKEQEEKQTAAATTQTHSGGCGGPAFYKQPSRGVLDPSDDWQYYMEYGFAAGPRDYNGH